MDLGRQRRASEIFDRVVDLPSGERIAALDEACGSDTELRAFVERLVKLDSEASAFDRVHHAVAQERLPTAERLVPGARVAGHVVLRLLGAGGSAQVWQVVDETTRVERALKVLIWTDPSQQRRLLKEARVQGSLKHPNVVPVEDVVDVGGVPGLLMPLVRGPALTALLNPDRLPVDEALELIRQVAAALVHVHGQGFTHRDLKPGNVLLDVEGPVRARVTDFGLVKEDGGSRHTRTGSVVGTLGYAAPEQLDDATRAGTPADVWALGVMLYELLSGRSCFPGRTLERVRQAQAHGAALEALPAEARAWGPLIAAMLAEAPGDRPTAADVLAQLPERSLGADSQVARRATAGTERPSGAPTDSLGPVDRGRPSWPWLALVTGVGVAALAWVWMLPTERPVEPVPVVEEAAPAPVEEPVDEVSPVVDEPAPVVERRIAEPEPKVEVEVAVEAPPIEVPVPLTPGTVEVEGETRATRLISQDGTVFEVGSVPPGRYQFEARLQEHGHWVQLPLEVAEGQVVRVRCDNLFGVCTQR